jgi:hypothetical protein
VKTASWKLIRRRSLQSRLTFSALLIWAARFEGGKTQGLKAFYTQAVSEG